MKIKLKSGEQITGWLVGSKERRIREAIFSSMVTSKLARSHFVICDELSVLIWDWAAAILESSLRDLLGPCRESPAEKKGVITCEVADEGWVLLPPSLRIFWGISCWGLVKQLDWGRLGLGSSVLRHLTSICVMPPLFFHNISYS